MMPSKTALALLVCAVFADAKVLWSSQPAPYSDLIQYAYPLGNGQLAGRPRTVSSRMWCSADPSIAWPFGNAGQETLNLNRDSLWSGGPFEDPNYIGGNPNGSVSSFLPGLRSFIFENGTGGDLTPLMGDDNNYGKLLHVSNNEFSSTYLILQGSYYVLGNISVTVSGVDNATNYKRMLDLSTGIHTTTYTSGNATFTR